MDHPATVVGHRVLRQYLAGGCFLVREVFWTVFSLPPFVILALTIVGAKEARTHFIDISRRYIGNDPVIAGGK